ncbi:TolB-like translocation protein [Pararhodonellum marinum]|uniref:hypothetical protein n=1 Tax=Pararhodonellum marinum TaxID=2755358 RepID=UPI001E3F7115|nr:hypothetical protein [Pararhodonellum marinum]
MNFNKNYFLWLMLCLYGFCVSAQVNSDLVMVETKSGFGGFSIVPETVRVLTDNPGYDNQPAFISEERLVFSSAPIDGTHDLIMYNFETGKFTNITRTENRSEFSPKLTDCKQYVGAVTVEEDSTQRLWLYPLNMGEPELLYDDIAPVGYYDWYDNKAAMFVLDEPHKLIFPFSRDDILTIDEEIGRSIQRRPKTDQITYFSTKGNIVVDGKIAYGLKGFDLKKRISESLGLGLGDAEDFIWLNKNELLMARDNELFIRNINKSQTWQKIANFNVPGYGKISRMTLSPKKKRLVLVMEKKE